MQTNTLSNKDNKYINTNNRKIISITRFLWLHTIPSRSLQTLPSLPQEIKPSNVSIATSSGCRLCGNPIDCEFSPCNHRVVCHGCSGMFKACCECKVCKS